MRISYEIMDVMLTFLNNKTILEFQQEQPHQTAYNYAMISNHYSTYIYVYIQVCIVPL